jgi:hypothetical protein
MLYVILSKCEILFFALREEHKLRMFKKDEETGILELENEEVM